MSKNIKVDGKTYKEVSKISTVSAEDNERIYSFYDVSDATATANDILEGKTAYIGNGYVTGKLDPKGQEVEVELDMASGDQIIPNTEGIKLMKKVTVKKPATLVPENIAVGINIGGVTGNFKGGTKEGIIDGTLEEFELPDNTTEVYKYRFIDFTDLTSVKLGTVQRIGEHAFDGCTQVESFSADFKLLQTLGDSAFSKFGGGRYGDERFNFDFSESAITEIPQNCFSAEDASSTPPKNMECFFPESINQIGANAFTHAKNSDFYFFTQEKAPTVNDIGTWSGTNGIHIFCPIDKINEYRTATNWTVVKDNIIGYLPAGTLEDGATLPKINDEGYELTWYKDKDLTEEATTVQDNATPYYAKAGDERKVFKIVSVSAELCSVTITDGLRTYVEGDKVNKDTVLEISATPNDPSYSLTVFTVNGEVFTSGNSITVDRDISVAVVYAEILPFGESPWSKIASVFKSGKAGSFWHVGDTKRITSKSGKQYTIRIADMQEGRYTCATGETTHGVLEFVECVNLNGTTSFAMNTSQKDGYWNGGGFAKSDMKNTYLPNILADLPVDMQAAIGEVNVRSGTGSGTSSGTSSSVCKLFLPAEMEMFDAKHYSIGLEECPKGQFDYYKTHNTDSDRKKQNVGTTSNVWYWLRSPHSGGSDIFCVVSSSGGWDANFADSNGGVAPCFAI